MPPDPFTIKYNAENYGRKPVGIYDAFVEALNFHESGIEIDIHKVDDAEYDPRSIFSLRKSHNYCLSLSRRKND